MIKPFWGGTLISGRETIAELEKGVADIALGSVYTKSGYEITWGMGLFMLGSPSPEVSLKVSKEIFEMFPEYQNEFPNVLVMGFRNVFPNYIQSIKPVNTLDDLQGITINSSTPGDVILPAFGAITVKVPPPEWYTSLQKGTFDASFLPMDTLKGFRLGEVVKYINLDMTIAYAGIPMTFMNKDKFKSLPPELQQLIMDSKEFLSNEQMKAFASSGEAGVEFAKEQGVEFVHLSKEDKEKWQNEMSKFGDKEAEKLNEIGKPGTEIWNATRRLIKEYSN